MDSSYGARDLIRIATQHTLPRQRLVQIAEALMSRDGYWVRIPAGKGAVN